MRVEERDGELYRIMQIGEGHCANCDEEYGPRLAEDIGYWAHSRHLECPDVTTDVWTEEELIECAKCDEPATVIEDVHVGGGDVSQSPFCDEHKFIQ